MSREVEQELLKSSMEAIGKLSNLISSVSSTEAVSIAQLLETLSNMKVKVEQGALNKISQQDVEVLKKPVMTLLTSTRITSEVARNIDHDLHALMSKVFTQV